MVGPPCYSSDNGENWQRIPVDEMGINGIVPEKGVEAQGNTLWLVINNNEIIKISISTLEVQKAGSVGENIKVIYPTSDGRVYIETDS